jgi:hypothetical protein
VALTPADQGYQLFQKMADRVGALEQQVEILMRARGANAQRAKVVAFSGGAMCTVEFVATGTQAAVPYVLNYTPVVNHGGFVVEYPGEGIRFEPVSAYLA